MFRLPNAPETAGRRAAEAPRRRRRVVAALALALLWLAPLALAVPVEAREPKLMEGKRTLYQKVLTRPAAQLRTEPDLAAPGTPVDAFSVYYVYDRFNVGGTEWLEVGAGREGRDTAFMETARSIDWKQSMTLAFTNPGSRMGEDGPRLSMFFDSKQALVDLLHNEAMVPVSREWRSEARRARQTGAAVPEGNPVVALEPAEHVDLQERFYLLPILEAEDVLVRPLRAKLRLMRVASVAEREEESAPPPASLEDFRVGVVFVVDTSASMNPYIERTREAIRKVFDTMRAADLKAEVSFGMVAFRDSTEAVPGLEYVSRVYAELEEETDPERFLTEISAMREAGVSSHGFMEDALGGIDTAMRMPGWQEIDAKYLVLITDASTRAAGDELASVDMTPADLNQQAQENGYAILTMHLLTAAGVNDHDSGAAQYRELSRAGANSLYYPIEEGSVSAFGQAVDSVAQDLLGLAQAAVSDELADQSRVQSAALREVGLSMQLAYLGRRQGTSVPDVIDSWIVDRDFEAVDRATVEPRVLLTKNQLNDLQTTIQRIVELQQARRLEPGEFFARLQSVAGNMVRDPQRIASGQVETLGDVLGEYLEGLPYDSEIMTLDERTFIQMGPVRQLRLVNRLKSKVELYRRFNEDDLWVALAEGAPEGEWVYPVPLDALP